MFPADHVLTRGKQIVRISRSPGEDLDAHLNIRLHEGSDECRIFVPKVYEEFKGNPRLEINGMAVEITMSDWTGDWDEFDTLHRNVVADRYCQYKGYSKALSNDFRHFLKLPLVKSIWFDRNSSGYKIIDPKSKDYRTGGKSSLTYVQCSR